jgi:hypothetical protein
MKLNGTENGAYKYQRGDSLLIPALASGKTLEEAAGASGVSKSTICRRQNDSAFRKEVQRVEGELVEVAIRLLSSAAEEAVSTLRELLKANGENVCLSAARAILDCVFRVREEAAANELRERIDALESLLKSVRQ